MDLEHSWKDDHELCTSGTRDLQAQILSGYHHKYLVTLLYHHVLTKYRDKQRFSKF